MLSAQQMMGRYVIVGLSIASLLCLGVVSFVLSIRDPATAYFIRLEDQRIGIRVSPPAFFRPALGPEGIRIWYTESVAFRATGERGTITNPLLDGEHTARGEIRFSLPDNTVTLALDEERWSPFNGVYDLFEFGADKTPRKGRGIK